MHEASLVDALFDQVDRARGAHPASSVREVTVHIGALAGVEGTLFRTAFDGLRGARGYGGASLVLMVEPARWRCEACGADVVTGAALVCGACGGDASLEAGGDIVLARLELEVRDV